MKQLITGCANCVALLLNVSLQRIVVQTAYCEPTRTLVREVLSVFDDEVRRKILEQGANLTLDQALTTLPMAKAATQRASNLKAGDVAKFYMSKKSCYRKGKDGKTAVSKKDSQSNTTEKPNGCWNGGSEKRHEKSSCPAR